MDMSANTLSLGGRLRPKNTARPVLAHTDLRSASMRRFSARSLGQSSYTDQGLLKSVTKSRPLPVGGEAAWPVWILGHPRVGDRTGADADRDVPGHLAPTIRMGSG